MNIYLITLEGTYVQAIKDGLKSIEVRTRIPKELTEGDIIFIAQKASHGKVVLKSEVRTILELRPYTLYAYYGSLIHCSYQYFNQYTLGRDKVFGIVLDNISQLPNNITTQSFLLQKSPQWFAKLSPATYYNVMSIITQ